MARRGRKRIRVNEFEELMLQDLKDWGDVTKADVHELVEIYGQRLLKEVKRKSPDRTGAYAKSWRVKHSIVDGARFKHLIYNKDKFRLTHLLEHGHATKNGGRTDKFPHLLETEVEINKEFTEAVKRLFGK